MRPPTPRLTQRDPRVLCGRGAGVLAGGVALGGRFAGRVVAGGGRVFGGGAGSVGGSGGVALLGVGGAVTTTATTLFRQSHFMNCPVSPVVQIHIGRVFTDGVQWNLFQFEAVFIYHHSIGILVEPTRMPIFFNIYKFDVYLILMGPLYALCHHTRRVICTNVHGRTGR